MSELAKKLTEHEMVLLYMSYHMEKYLKTSRTVMWEKVLSNAGVDVLSPDEVKQWIRFNSEFLLVDSLRGLMDWLMKRYEQNELEEDHAMVASYCLLEAYVDPQLRVQKPLPSDQGQALQSQALFSSITIKTEGNKKRILEKSGTSSVVNGPVNGAARNTFEQYKTDNGVYQWDKKYLSRMQKMVKKGVEKDQLKAWLGNGCTWWNSMSKCHEIDSIKSGEEIRKDVIALVAQTEQTYKLEVPDCDQYVAIMIFFGTVPDQPLQLGKNVERTRLYDVVQRSKLSNRRTKDAWRTWFVYELFHNDLKHLYFNTTPATYTRVQFEVLNEAKCNSWFGVDSLLWLNEKVEHEQNELFFGC